jgi:hypothetical protein
MRALADLIARRRQIIDMITAESNRQRQMSMPNEFSSEGPK